MAEKPLSIGHSLSSSSLSGGIRLLSWGNQRAEHPNPSLYWRSGFTCCEFYLYDMCVEHTQVYQARVVYPNDDVDNVDKFSMTMILILMMIFMMMTIIMMMMMMMMVMKMLMWVNFP